MRLHDLVTACHLNHSFRHPSALLAKLLIISLSFNLLYAFYAGKFKPQLRSRMKNPQPSCH